MRWDETRQILAHLTCWLSNKFWTIINNALKESKRTISYLNWFISSLDKGKISYWLFGVKCSTILVLSWYGNTNFSRSASCQISYRITAAPEVGKEVEEGFWWFYFFFRKKKSSSWPNTNTQAHLPLCNSFIIGAGKLNRYITWKLINVLPHLTINVCKSHWK